jgi:hypothetical protein
MAIIIIMHGGSKKKKIRKKKNAMLLLYKYIRNRSRHLIAATNFLANIITDSTDLFG